MVVSTASKGNVEKEAGAAAAGNVEEVIDATEPSDRILDQRLPPVDAADVERVEAHARARRERAAQAIGVDIDQRQPVFVTVGSENAGPVTADSAGGASNDGDPG